MEWLYNAMISTPTFLSRITLTNDLRTILASPRSICCIILSISCSSRHLCQNTLEYSRTFIGGVKGGLGRVGGEEVEKEELVEDCRKV